MGRRLGVHIGAQGDGLENVAAALNATIDNDFCPTADRLDDLR